MKTEENCIASNLLSLIKSTKFSLKASDDREETKFKNRKK